MTGPISFPATGSWGSYQTATKAGVNLTAGRHILRLSLDTAGIWGYLGSVDYVLVERSTAPSAPTSLTAVAASKSQINLSWADNSSNETGFKVERKTGGAGAYAQIGQVGAGVTAYNDAGLQSGTQYFYRVRATSAGGDSSYLQLTENNDSSLTVTAAGGTRMSYLPLGGVYKCAEIKDGNGNFITVSYDAAANLQTVTDTLGRAVNFGYNADGSLKEITQTWHREVESGSATQTVTETHQWAKFFYADKTLRTNFAGLSLFNATNGQTIRALTRVKLADDSSYTFNYTTWGQVNQIAQYATDGRLLNYVSLDLPADKSVPQSDCPRPTERRDWAAYWNGDEDGAGAASEEAVTSYSVTDGAGGGGGLLELPEGGRQQGLHDRYGEVRPRLVTLVR